MTRERRIPPEALIMVKARIIGARIRSLREEKGWTQGILAYKADTTAAQISRLENNDRPAAGAVIIGKIALALGTTVEYLLDQTDDPTRQPDSVDGQVESPEDTALRARAEELVRRWRLVARYSPDQLDTLVNIAFTQAALVLGAARVDEMEEVEEETKRND